MNGHEFLRRARSFRVAAGSGLLSCVLAGSVGCQPEEPKPDDATPSLSEWERGMAQELLRPPIVWESSATDPDEQLHALWDWNPGFVVPETYATLEDWIDSDAQTIDTIVTNEPTGAEYRLTGRKHAAGIEAQVRFIGNRNWQSR